MKKLMRIVLVMLIAVFLSASAQALTFGDGGVALKSALDNIATDGNFNIDVQNDYLNDDLDSYWETLATGTSAHTLIFQIAGFKDTTKFGIYDSTDISNKLELFDGAIDYQGSAKSLNVAKNALSNDWNYYIGSPDGTPDADFNSGNWGYYLDSTGGTGGGLFYSDTNFNGDQLDHMAAYPGSDSNVENLTIPRDYDEDGTAEEFITGDFKSNEYLLAWEDLYAPGDADYNDLGILVESVQPIPEPATMFLFGTGLLGLAALGRRKYMK